MKLHVKNVKKSLLRIYNITSYLLIYLPQKLNLNKPKTIKPPKNRLIYNFNLRFQNYSVSYWLKSRYEIRK